MASIKIDLDRKLGTVDRRIFGGFIEHVGRCIYGGIFDEGSPLSDEHGYRQDVLDALRPLRMPVLRWPGGNFVSGYHWTDGIGPRDERPRRLDFAWGGEESNRFGTGELVEYCRLLGTEPYICINMGTGSIDEAHAWVEYCNSTRNTYWANLRREHGYEEPFNVRYWGLGNEMYGAWQTGALDAQDYVKRATEFAKVLRWTDPSIELVACGKDGLSEWDQVVLEGLARFVEYHSLHMYTGSADYYSNVFAPHQAERALRITEATIERVRYQQRIEHPVHIVYDEWNVWYRALAARTGLEEPFDLSDALAVASYLNILIRHCRSVRMANLAQMVNAIAPITTSADGLLLQTIHHPLRLYAEHTQEVALDVWVDSPVHALEELWTQPSRAPRVADLGPFPMLDVSATRDEAGRELTLGIVNRDRDTAHTASVEIAGGATLAGIAVYEVSGPDPHARNTFEAPEAVRTLERHVRPEHPLEYTLPPCSVTLLLLYLA